MNAGGVPSWTRIEGWIQRNAHWAFPRRPFAIRFARPIISFTFDDFPQSALHVGGEVLENAGARATYYASLGLMGTIAATGQMFELRDLASLVERGHELGCHTFHHSHSWNTPARLFERSILDNRARLAELHSGVSFKTFSYPISAPRIASKYLAAKYFRCCRGGGQTINRGLVDLAYLKAFFLEQSGGDLDRVKSLIQHNARVGGWLIFATHDISTSPTRWGCTPAFFRAVVQFSVDSGARIAPVGRVCEELG